MNRYYHYFPQVSIEEMTHIQNLTSTFTDEDLRSFSIIYNSRRRDSQIILLLSLVSLVTLPGLQRFYLEHIGMGFLYLFTVGLCFVGTIMDIVNYKDLSNEYNIKKANEVYGMMGKSANPYRS